MRPLSLPVDILVKIIQMFEVSSNTQRKKEKEKMNPPRVKDPRK